MNKLALLKQIDKRIEELPEMDVTGHLYWNTFREMVENFKAKEDKKLIKQRKREFYAKLETYLTDYPPTMLREFYNYWTEHNENGIKMRFEMEKVFDIKRRLVTWKKNSNKFSNDGTDSKTGFNALADY